MKLSDQLAPSVVPVIREYVDARISEALANLNAELARLHATLNAAAATSAIHRGAIEAEVLAIKAQERPDVTEVALLRRRLDKLRDDFDSEVAARVAARQGGRA